jgi:hypothetical protein
MATEQMWWQLAKRGLKYEICERKGEPRATAAPVENAQLRAATCVQLLPPCFPASASEAGEAENAPEGAC